MKKWLLADWIRGLFGASAIDSGMAEQELGGSRPFLDMNLEMTIHYLACALDDAAACRTLVPRPLVEWTRDPDGTSRAVITNVVKFPCTGDLCPCQAMGRTQGHS